MKYSLVIPVYRNEGSIPELLQAVQRLDAALDNELETVFVVDGSPDRCAEVLGTALPQSGLQAQLVAEKALCLSFQTK